MKKAIKIILAVIAIGIVIFGVYFCWYFLTVDWMSGPGPSSRPKDCLRISVETCETENTVGKVQGTLTNNCSEKVNAVRIWVTVFTSSGKARDDEYIYDIEPGESKPFETFITTDGKKIDRCSTEINYVY